MKDWLLLWPGHGEELQHMARVESSVFRSGDGDMPEPGDLKSAVEEFARRLDRDRLDPRLDVKDFAFILVPLDNARIVEASLTQRYGINLVKPLDLGIHVA